MLYTCRFLGDHFGCDKKLYCNQGGYSDEKIVHKLLLFSIDQDLEMKESCTIGKFNSMIEKQKQQEGEALISTVLFNNQSFVLDDCVKLYEIA